MTVTFLKINYLKKKKKRFELPSVILSSFDFLIRDCTLKPKFKRVLLRLCEDIFARSPVRYDHKANAVSS